MNVSSVQESLRRSLGAGLDIYERRSGTFQLIVPIRHEDGDMVDIYLQDSPRGDGYIRICDFGMTLMRLSYTLDLNTPTRQRIFDSILMNNGVANDDGNLFLDTPITLLYESILQFAGCAQKVCNMRYWNRENIRSAFYDDLNEYVENELTQFSPVPGVSPLPDYPITVDWLLKHNSRDFYLYGVRGDDKAKSVALSLRECQQAHIPFISLVVHENMDDLGSEERFYLTKYADDQYPTLDDFREQGVANVVRLAGVAS